MEASSKSPENSKVPAAKPIRYRLAPGMPPQTLAIADHVATLTGLDPQALCDDPRLWFARVFDEHRAPLLDALQRVAHGQSQTVEYGLAGDDGRTHFFRDSFTLSRDADGRAQIVGERLLIGREDMSALRAAPAAGFHDMLLDTLPIGLALARMDGELVEVNPAFARIIGRCVPETLGLTYWQITPQDYAEQEAEQLALLNDTGRYGPYEKHYIHRDGHWVPVRLSGLLVERDGEPFIWSSVEDISDLKAAEQELRRSEQELREIIDNLPDTFYRTDAQGRIALVSRTVESLLGWTAEELIGRKLAELYVEPDGRERFLAALAAGQGTVLGYEAQLWRRDGSKIWVATSSHYLYDADGQVIGVEGAARDISAQRAAQAMLRQAAAVFETAAEAALITDCHNVIVAVNPAFSEITGYSAEQALGRTPAFLRSDRHQTEFYDELWLTLQERDRWQGEIWHRCRSGQVIPTWQTSSAVRGESGKITHHVWLFADITPIKRSQEQLNHLAHHDPLTGLANRLVFDDRLAHDIQVARRDKRQLAVLFMDLDRFKDVNDSLGHPAGDELLCEAARRLSATVRAQDTVARLGGDEFIVVLDAIDEPQDAATLAMKLIEAFQPPFEVAGHLLRLTMSIGISLYPRDGRNVATLVKNADAAMYRAKEDGRDGFHFYTEQLTEAAFARLTLETALRHAVQHAEFELHYQPQVSLDDGRLLGAEALVRWRHPERGLIYPDTFIPLAEQTGLVADIGAWVMRAACEQLCRWDSEGRVLPRISMNIAVAQVQDAHFAGRVAACMAQTGVAAERIELEITEGYVMHKPKQAQQTLSDLRELGINVAIDDFGTGYSSLSQLKQLPINKLKIDKSFVRDIPADRNDEAITLAVIALADSLGLGVIAEGVETAEQREFLRRHGCVAAQGSLFSMPMPAADFAAQWLPPVR